MKKKIIPLLALCMSICMAAGLASCTNGGGSSSQGGSSNVEQSSSAQGGSSTQGGSSSQAGSSSQGGNTGGGEQGGTQLPDFVEWQSGEGTAFDINGKLYEIDAFGSMPRTFETYLQLDPSVTGEAGIVVGNYMKGVSELPYLSLSISDGQPRLDINGTTFSFNEVDVRSTSYVHLAVCLDKNANEAKCYVNGELIQTLSKSVADLAYEVPLRVGCDYRDGNQRVFKGKIRSLNFYKDIRTTREVNVDMTGLDRTDENLLGAYELVDLQASATELTDLSKNARNAVIKSVWLDSVDAPENYAYSFAAIGDTQHLLELYPDKVDDIYEWLVNSKDTHNIQYVMGLGDIVEHLYMSEGNLAVEWQIAREAIGKLDGVIPYSLIRGNHDASNFFNETFGTDTYLSGVDGTYDGKIENTYRTFVAGNYQYLLLTLDFEPSAEVLAWANEVVEAFPNHRVIVTTHSFIHHDGDYTDNCQPIWDDFASKHANIMMVLCGHVGWDHIEKFQLQGEKGNTVTQMLINPQYIDKFYGPTGLVAMLYFDETGENIQVRYYSTVRNQYFNAYNQFDLNLGEYANLGLIGADTEKPKIKTIGAQMGVAGTAYTLPQILVSDNSGENITPTYTVYKKGDMNKTALPVTGGKFTPTEGGYYVLEITAKDSANNEQTCSVELPVRSTALAANVLEGFGSEATLSSFVRGADAEWLSEWKGKSGVLHLAPNDTDKSYYAFRLFDALGDYALEFNSITLSVWVDARDENDGKVSTSFYDTYEGKWKGFGNSNGSGNGTWHKVVLEDFYNWEYFSESMKTSKGGQLFWSWTKNTHIYIDEITFDAKQEIEVSTDKELYVVGDTVNVQAALKADNTRPLLFSVTDPDGYPVTVTDKAFQMTKEGDYTLTVSLESPSHYASQKTVVIKCWDKFIKVASHADKYPTGEAISIPTGTYFDPKTNQDVAGATVSVAVGLNGSPVTVVDGKFTPAVEGVYVLTYTASVGGETVRTETYKVFVSNKVVEFTPSEIDCLVGNGEYLEEFEGAYGVVKYTNGSSIWGKSNTFKTHLTVDELKALDWDVLEARVWFAEGTNPSNPDPSEENWVFGDSASGTAGRNTWVTMWIGKESLETQFATLDAFYTAFAGDGAKLCSIWNTENSYIYIDYIQMRRKSVSVNEFADQASAAICLNGNTTVGSGASYSGGTAATWQESYQGASGVIKTRCNPSYAGDGHLFTFNGMYTAQELIDLNWSCIEIKVYIDKSGEFWLGTYGSDLSKLIAGGDWKTVQITKSFFEEKNTLEAFATAITSAAGAKLFYGWSTADADVYFDYIRLIMAN